MSSVENRSNKVSDKHSIEFVEGGENTRPPPADKSGQQSSNTSSLGSSTSNNVSTDKDDTGKQASVTSSVVAADAISTGDVNKINDMTSPLPGHLSVAASPVIRGGGSKDTLWHKLMRSHKKLDDSHHHHQHQNAVVVVTKRRYSDDAVTSEHQSSDQAVAHVIHSDTVQRVLPHDQDDDGFAAHALATVESPPGTEDERQDNHVTLHSVRSQRDVRYDSGILDLDPDSDLDEANSNDPSRCANDVTAEGRHQAESGDETEEGEGGQRVQGRQEGRGRPTFSFSEISLRLARLKADSTPDTADDDVGSGMMRVVERHSPQDEGQGPQDTYSGFRYTLSTDNADLSKQVVEYVVREATASMGSPGSGSARYHRDNQHQPETDRDHHYGYDDDQASYSDMSMMNEAQMGRGNGRETGQTREGEDEGGEDGGGRLMDPTAGSHVSSLVDSCSLNLISSSSSIISPAAVRRSAAPILALLAGDQRTTFVQVLSELTSLTDAAERDLVTLTAYAKMKDVEWQLVSERLHKETLQLRARLRQCAGGGAPGGGCPVDGTTSNMTSSTSSTCGKGGHSTGGGLSIMDRSVRRSLNQIRWQADEALGMAVERQIRYNDLCLLAGIQSAHLASLTARALELDLVDLDLSEQGNAPVTTATI